MKRLWLLLLVTFAALGQMSEPESIIDRSLPGQPSRATTAKLDFAENQKDSLELRRLTRQLQMEINRDGTNVVNVNTIKDAERAEKLARNIKDRLKRY